MTVALDCMSRHCILYINSDIQSQFYITLQNSSSIEVYRFNTKRIHFWLNINTAEKIISEFNFWTTISTPTEKQKSEGDDAGFYHLPPAEKPRFV